MDVETIGAFESFLKWGPLGLAGLMLVLVIFALVAGQLTPDRTNLLKTFMYVGAACFVAALVAQYFEAEEEHRLVISVLPNDIDDFNFPPPKIKANGREIDRKKDYFITETTALSIDVSKAMGLYRATATRADTAEAKAAETETELMAANQSVVEAQRVIETQNQSLEQALSASRTLAAQFETLSVRLEAEAVEIAPLELQSIERDIQSLQRDIQTGVNR